MRLRVISLALMAACGAAEAQEPVTVELSELDCSSPSTEAPWESAAWPGGTESCSWIAFEGRTNYEIEHPLGRAPRNIALYLSFSEDGASSAPSAGNTARIVSVTDSTVTIRNDTNEDFFLKVVLE